MPDQTRIDLAYLLAAIPWGLDAALVDPATLGLIVLELGLALVGVNPAFYDDDPYVGFSSYLPLFVIMLFRGAPIRPAVLFLPVPFLIIARQWR